METRSKGDDNEAKSLFIKRVLRSEVNTAIPGIISSFDPTTQTVMVTPAIRSIQTINNEQEFKQLPELVQVPVRSIYGKTAGFSLTFPISKGDECLLVFAQRAIDNWHEFGGIQNPVEPVVPRTFNISDAFALVGVSSSPNTISGYQQDCIEIRNSDRNTRVSVYNDKVEIFAGSSEIVINKDGDITMKTDTKVTVDAGTDVDITAAGDLNVQADNANITVDSDATIEVTGDAEVTANNIDVIALIKTTITSPVTEWLGNLKLTGLLEVVGIIKGTADVIALSEDDDPITLLTHLHGGVQVGAGDSGEPKAP